VIPTKCEGENGKERQGENSKMSMRIDLHAKVRSRDGKDAGNVEGAIVDPATNQIREVVVDKGGLLDRPRLVPFAEIEAASRDGNALRLRLTQAEVDALPAYSPERYVVLSGDRAPPADFGLPAAAYRQPAALIDTTPPRPPKREARLRTRCTPLPITTAAWCA
jgi:hypothetical protein